MHHTPLQFLRHDLKKSKRKKAMRLPRWSFLNRFRLRILFQNIPNYLVLFVGICAERFQTGYRLSFPQDVRAEAALKGEPPGSSEEQYFEETSLRDVSSEIFRQANRRTSSRTTDFLRFFYCLAALLLPFLQVTGIISWTFRRYVVQSRDTIIQYIHHGLLSSLYIVVSLVWTIAYKIYRKIKFGVSIYN